MSTTQQMDRILRGQRRVGRRVSGPLPLDPAITRKLSRQQGSVDASRPSRDPADHTGAGWIWRGEYSINMSRQVTVTAAPDNPDAEQWIRHTYAARLLGQNVHHDEGD